MTDISRPVLIRPSGHQWHHKVWAVTKASPWPMRGWSTGIQRAEVSTGILRGTGERDNPVGLIWATPSKQCLGKEDASALVGPWSTPSPAPRELSCSSRLAAWTASLREDRCVERLSWHTPVFLTGVLEYLTASILERASNEACNHQNMLITPEHGQRAVDDKHRSHLFEDDTNPQVDGMPSLRK